MEVTQMLATHSFLINAFLGFLLGGLLLPFVTAKSPAGFKKASFIYTMMFQAIITMVAFAGLVAVFTGDLGWSLTTILMVVLWAIMMYIEIQKHKVIKIANVQNAQTHKVLRGASVKISLVQIFLLAIMMGIMMLKAQGTVNL
ncbi:MAG: hypothetical protein Q9M36_13735 [Sulfurovum sp.]|nr:hypothetical protein [Sulfurovum sp.]